MESQSKMFDNDVKFEKEKAIARFNRVRTVMRLWQIIEVAIAFAAVSWCSARAPAVVRSTGASLFEFSTCVFFNHHVVFLIGNAIIVSLVMLRRQSCACATATAAAGRRDVYDEYVKYSEAARALPPPQQSEEDVAMVAELGGDGDCDKQIVAVRTDCDDVAAAIEKAARQIRRFQRTQSETLRREIAVRPELRRSETESRLETVSSEAAEIENLSSEEFRRRVDAFIDEHWSKRAAKLEGNTNYRS